MTAYAGVEQVDVERSWKKSGEALGRQEANDAPSRSSRLLSRTTVCRLGASEIEVAESTGLEIAGGRQPCLPCPVCSGLSQESKLNSSVDFVDASLYVNTQAQRSQCSMLWSGRRELLEEGDEDGDSRAPANDSHGSGAE